MVIFADSARADLKAIAMWIGSDNPDRAATFVAEIHRACESLVRHPKRFPLVAGHRQGLRKRSVRGYLIFYFIVEGHVEVARIVQGSRDWVSLLDDGH